MKHDRPAPVDVPVHFRPIPGFKAKSLEARAARRLTKQLKLKKQGGRCLYCQQKISRRAATAEHRVPLARGGTDMPHNIDVACLPCNQAKGDLTKREFELAIFNPSFERHPWPLYLACVEIRLKRRAELACKRLAAMVGPPVH